MRKPDDSQYDREIAHHIDKMTAENIGLGIAPAEARRQALIAFGGSEQVKQQLREVHLSACWQGMRAHLASAARFVRRSPAFAATIVLTLALSIGANTAVYSAMDAIVLRPLPFPHAEELTRLHQLDSKGAENFVAPSRLEDWNRLNSTFQSISGYYTGDATLTSGSLPEKITIGIVAPRFLKLWQVSPQLGRDFTSEEEKFSGPGAVLVTHRFWVNHLDADSNAAGKTLRLGSSAYRVAGVLPASFLSPDPAIDIFEPNAVDATYSQNRNATWFTVLGRLKPGVSVQQAGADLATVQTDLGKQFPETDSHLTITLQPLKSLVIGNTRNSLWLLYGAVTLLLIIACTNIGALMLARTAEREHELSIRSSLGASRFNMIGQLLTEVLVLAVAGSLLGLGIAAAAPHLFLAFAKDLPRAEEIAINWRIVLYALATGVAATLACGLFPALRATRRSLSGSIAHGSRTQVSIRNRGQWVLVGIQVALSVTLLVGSGLLLRSFQALGRVHPGFDPDHILTLRISAGWAETTDMGKLGQRIDRTLDALRNTPGVEAAATAGTIPGNSFGVPAEFQVTDLSTDSTRHLLADARYVSTGYFATLHIPLLQGRDCGNSTALPSVVVNRSFAAKYFSTPPIGHHLNFSPAQPYMRPGEIRGIVGDAREQGLETVPQPTVYWCFSAPAPDPWFLIRTHGDPAALAGTLRQRIYALEPARSVFGMMPLMDRIDDRQAENRLRTVLITLFALTAVALVSIGLHGTISFLARTRRREIGLRLALGAAPRAITRMFLRKGVHVTLAGGLTGLLMGAALTRLLASTLFGVSTLDPLTYGGVLLLTLAVALSASLVPSLRASKVDPVQMLREE